MENDDKTTVIDHLGILVRVLNTKEIVSKSISVHQAAVLVITWQPTHSRNINGNVSKTHTFPNRCQAFLRPNFWQRRNSSPPSDEMPTKTVEMPSAIWPMKSKTPA